MLIFQFLKALQKISQLIQAQELCQQEDRSNLTALRNKGTFQRLI